MKYFMVVDCDYGWVASEVNSLLFQGWELYGSPMIATNQDGYLVYGQALVKREG